MTFRWADRRIDDLEYIERIRNLSSLAEACLPELLRAPDLSAVVARTKAWARDTWYTEDGEHFYLRRFDTNDPRLDLPVSSKDEVLVLTQQTYKRFFRYMELFNRFLAPKLQEVANNRSFSAVEKAEHLFWLRQRFPAPVVNRVPVVRNARVEGFCWPWQHRLLRVKPSPNEERSDRLIDAIFADTECLMV